MNARISVLSLTTLALTLPLFGGCGGGKDPGMPGTPPVTYTVGGNISGLNGTVTLTNNGGDARVVIANGAFTFATALANGAAYAVAVSPQPTGQFCTVTNGSGSIASANVTNVAVNCITNTYTIGGSVTGLAGSGLVLQNNDGDDLPRSADGAFTFATAVAHGDAYSVTVLTQPTNPAQTCTPTDNTGTALANVANVAIACVTNTTVGSAVIGASGGTVTGFYGAQIVVPAGAVPTPVTIGLTRDSANSPAFAVPDIDAIGATYELTPHGQSFSTPVTIRVPFDPAQVPNDTTPVLYKAEIGGVFTALPTTVNGNFLEATITGFSWVIPAAQANKPRMVYAVQNNAGALQLVGHRINTTTGELLAPSSNAPVGETPTSVTAHPSRRFLFVTHSGSAAVNNIAANSVAVYRLNTVNGNLVGAATSNTPTGAPTGYQPTMPTVHPSGKFLYVMNFGAVSSNAGGDLSVFSINASSGALTLTGSATGNGAQPMAMGFNRLGTRAYVLFEGSASANPLSGQIAVFNVDATTGALTGPTSTTSACGVLGGGAWSLKVDVNEKFAYVTCLFVDQVRTFAINSGTGALTFQGGPSVTTNSRMAALAIDGFGRYLFAARQQPWLSKNILSYAYDSTTGALTLRNDILSACGGACGGPISVIADPQGNFLYALDAPGGLAAYRVDQTNGALTAANSMATYFRPGIGGVGLPFTFAVTGASPVWQNNCTHGCAMSGAVAYASSGGGGGGGGSTTTNPSPPTSFILQVSRGIWASRIVSTPGGIDDQDPPGPNNFSAQFPAGTNVNVCVTPRPTQPQGYDVTWSGSCSGTGTCSSVLLTSDKSCHAELTPVAFR